MSEYKTSIIIGLIYLASLFLFSWVRTVSLITLIFLALYFTFHGILAFGGKRVEKIHFKFVETHFATALVIGLYAASTVLYFHLQNLLV